MMGYSNICLTGVRCLFKSVRADVKAAIFSETDNPVTIVDFISPLACFHVHLKNNSSILEYIAAVAGIINKMLNVRCSTKVVFYDKNENYFRAEVPLICTIPLYVLRYFSQVYGAEHECKASLRGLVK